jgi:hypothetical protein
MSYKIQYVSNLFLDLYKHNFKKILAPSCNNLALLGNISSPSNKLLEDFLKYVSDNWEKTYIIPGPLEHSSLNLHYKDCINILSERICVHNSIELLNNSSVDIANSDITLCGTTYWPKHPYMQHPAFYEFSHIYLSGHAGLRKLLGRDIEFWHTEDSTYIRDSIKRKNRRFILLTHYNPLYVFSDSSATARMQASNSSDLLLPPVQIWLSGASSKTVSGSNPQDSDVFFGINSYCSYRPNPNINKNYSSTTYTSLRNRSVELF